MTAARLRRRVFFDMEFVADLWDFYPAIERAIRSEEGWELLHAEAVENGLARYASAGGQDDPRRFFQLASDCDTDVFAAIHDTFGDWENDAVTDDITLHLMSNLLRFFDRANACI